MSNRTQEIKVILREYQEILFFLALKGNPTQPRGPNGRFGRSFTDPSNSGGSGQDVPDAPQTPEQIQEAFNKKLTGEELESFNKYDENFNQIADANFGRLKNADESLKKELNKQIKDLDIVISKGAVIESDQDIFVLLDLKDADITKDFPHGVILYDVNFIKAADSPDTIRAAITKENLGEQGIVVRLTVQPGVKGAPMDDITSVLLNRGMAMRIDSIDQDTNVLNGVILAYRPPEQMKYAFDFDTKADSTEDEKPEEPATQEEPEVTVTSKYKTPFTISNSDMKIINPTDNEKSVLTTSELIKLLYNVKNTIKNFSPEERSLFMGGKF